MTQSFTFVLVNISFTFIRVYILSEKWNELEFNNTNVRISIATFACFVIKLHCFSSIVSLIAQPNAFCIASDYSKSANSHRSMTAIHSQYRKEHRTFRYCFLMTTFKCLIQNSVRVKTPQAMQSLLNENVLRIYPFDSFNTPLLPQYKVESGKSSFK